MPAMCVQRLMFYWSAIVNPWSTDFEIKDLIKSCRWEGFLKDYTFCLSSRTNQTHLWFTVVSVILTDYCNTAGFFILLPFSSSTGCNPSVLYGYKLVHSQRTWVGWASWYPSSKYHWTWQKKPWVYWAGFVVQASGREKQKKRIRERKTSPQPNMEHNRKSNQTIQLKKTKQKQIIQVNLNKYFSKKNILKHTLNQITNILILIM